MTLRWTWLALALALPTIWRLLRRRPEPRVSDRWIREQLQRSSTQGLDGVSWSWPINKITADAGRFNAARLRRRA